MNELSAEWPKTAEEAEDAGRMIRFFGVVGQRAWLAKWKAIDAKDPAEHMRLLEKVLACVAIMGALRDLRAVSQTAADACALRYWEMCEDGGSVGEFLWEWLNQEGINPDTVTLDEATKA